MPSRFSLNNPAKSAKVFIWRVEAGNVASVNQRMASFALKFWRNHFLLLPTLIALIEVTLFTVPACSRVQSPTFLALKIPIVMGVVISKRKSVCPCHGVIFSASWKHGALFFRYCLFNLFRFARFVDFLWFLNR